jgi:hypothetical protein
LLVGTILNLNAIHELGVCFVQFSRQESIEKEAAKKSKAKMDDEPLEEEEYVFV